MASFDGSYFRVTILVILDNNLYKKKYFVFILY